MTKEELAEIKSWVAENITQENGFNYAEVKEVEDSGRYTVNFLYDTLNPKAVKTYYAWHANIQRRKILKYISSYVSSS
nr:MAG TPA: hypothetical protein [Caudoviricetes sp.]